jgi:hypothetical protein
MLNNQQARVIDPILTTFVRGYSNNEMVGNLLFPDVYVGSSGGQVIEFGKEGFMLIDTQRAPGGATKRIEFGYLGKPYACENHALEALVPDELGRDARIVPGIDLGQNAVGLVFDSMALKLEYQRATKARDPAQYAGTNKVALSGATLWSAPTSNPKADVQAGRAAIRAATGKYPNVMILPPGGIYKLDQHPLIRDRLKYIGADSATPAMLAQYFQVEALVEGNAVHASQLNGALLDVWGNDVILAYVPKSFRSQKAPSYGYTYVLAGHPNVKTPYRDENRESWIYGVKHERTPVIAGAGAGYLIQNAF